MYRAYIIATDDTEITEVAAKENKCHEINASANDSPSAFVISVYSVFILFIG
jgi:hypothetical protein